MIESEAAPVAAPLECTSEPEKPNNEYRLPFPSKEIIVVSSLADVMRFCDYLSQRVLVEDIVQSGFDSEWKPVRPDCASLLQIAFTNRVYLIDVLRLRETSEPGEGQDSSFGLISKVYFTNPVSFFEIKNWWNI
jgi:hypothetical protein